MSYSEAEANFQAAIKDLREVATDLDTATKISAIADRLTEARLAIERGYEERFKEKLRQTLPGISGSLISSII